MLQNGALINAGNVKRHLETKHSFWAQLSPKVQAECTQNNRTANLVWRMYSNHHTYIYSSATCEQMFTEVET